MTLSDEQYDVILGASDHVHRLARRSLVIAHETGDRTAAFARCGGRTSTSARRR